MLTSASQDDREWEENWKTYKNDSSTKDKDIFGLKGWTKEDTQDLKEELKEKCSLLADESIVESDKESYDNFAKYCTRGITIKEKADKLGLRVVSAETQVNDQDWNIWIKREREKGKLKEELETLGVKMGSFNGPYEIKNRCKAVTTINKKNDNYEDILNAYKKVCTRQDKE